MLHTYTGEKSYSKEYVIISPDIQQGEGERGRKSLLKSGEQGWVGVSAEWRRTFNQLRVYQGAKYQEITL